LHPAWLSLALQQLAGLAAALRPALLLCPLEQQPAWSLHLQLLPACQEPASLSRTCWLLLDADQQI